MQVDGLVKRRCCRTDGVYGQRVAATVPAISRRLRSLIPQADAMTGVRQQLFGLGVLESGQLSCPVRTASPSWLLPQDRKYSNKASMAMRDLFRCCY